MQGEEPREASKAAPRGTGTGGRASEPSKPFLQLETSEVESGRIKTAGDVPIRSAMDTHLRYDDRLIPLQGTLLNLPWVRRNDDVE